MSIQISRGIQLPAFDVKMLSLGKLIAVPFKQYLKEGEAFWLYPSQQLPLDLKLEEYYKPEYLDASREATSEFTSPPIAVRIWGVCDYHGFEKEELTSLVKELKLVVENPLLREILSAPIQA